MAMNFWENQRRRRLFTTFYLLLFFILTILVAVASEIAMQEWAGKEYNQLHLPLVGIAYATVILLVGGYQYLMMSYQGGAYVAKMAGGREVSPETEVPIERQLLNIVEEMALAAGVPKPQTFILPDKNINAFAAGLRPKTAAIAVTEGALEQLNRDELQGVIAHEVGHISNSDMVINLRLTAMLLAFFFLISFGIRILAYGRPRSNKKEGGNAFILAVIILIAAGAITWLVGQILKCTISRQREYLADACSVQYTRNPEGLANALRKIGAEQVDTSSGKNPALSHLYFFNPPSLQVLFATHPPLLKRIAAIEGTDSQKLH